MQNFQVMQERSNSKRKRWTYTAILIAAIIIIVVIVVPCAVLIPRSHRPAAATILLPLYIYPESNSTWEPLYDAIQTRPMLNFVVIINPSSGPGDSSAPNDQYAEQVARLNNITSVKTVGYVRTNYTDRPIDDVLADIRTYSGWAAANASLAMDGIFLDESPHQYSSASVNYMRNVTMTIKSTEGLQSPKMTIRNPGVIPDARFNDTNTDVVVFFESDYQDYAGRIASLQTASKDRSKYSIMVNSVPDMSLNSLRTYVSGLSRLAQYLFITDNTQDYYESFGADWNAFASVVPT